MTFVSPKQTSTEPVAFAAKSGKNVISRKASQARPSGLEKLLIVCEAQLLATAHTTQFLANSTHARGRTKEGLNFSPPEGSLPTNMNSLLSCRIPKVIARLATVLTLSLALPFTSFGQSIEWAADTQNFDASFDDEEISASYEFTNTSDSAISIVDVTASCGCTVPSLVKKDYEAGESGELTAIFDIGSRQGKQRKVITVVAATEGDETETYELQLNVDIPVPVTYKPRVRFWKINSEPSTQDIEVTFHEKYPMMVTGLTRKEDSVEPAFDYEIETVTEGLSYVIKLTPKNPEQKSRDIFFLQSEQDESGLLLKYPIYGYVR